MSRNSFLWLVTTPCVLFGSAVVFAGVIEVSEGQWGGLAFVAVGSLFFGLAGIVLWGALRTRKPTRKPPPGVEVRFRARRTFFTSIAYAAIPAAGCPLGFAWAGWGQTVAVILGALAVIAYVAFVFLVPPRGGHRTYIITADGLTIAAAGKRRTVRWDDIELVRHRPFVVVPRGGLQERYDDHLELVTTGSAEPLVIVGAHRQPSMSVMIVDLSREHVLRRLLATFDREGQVRLGELTLDRDGIQGQDGGRLSWRSDWRLERGADEHGVALTIQAPQGQSVVARVPEETVAQDLLTALSSRLAPK